jgi:hypothetical protein
MAFLLPPQFWLDLLSSDMRFLNFLKIYGQQLVHPELLKAWITAHSLACMKGCASKLAGTSFCRFVGRSGTSFSNCDDA